MEKTELFFEVFDEFLSLHDYVYIYGTGEYGKACLAYCKRRGKEIKGFISSSETGEYEGIPVFNASYVKKLLSKKDGIVLGMNEKNCADVFQSNVFFCDVIFASDIDLYVLQLYAYGLLDNHANCERFDGKVNEVLIVQLEITYGDILWSTALLREIKNEYPNARVTVVVNKAHKSLFKYCPYIDLLIIYEPVDFATQISEGMVDYVNKFVQKNLMDLYDLVFLPRLQMLNTYDPMETLLIMQNVKSKCKLGHCIVLEKKREEISFVTEQMFNVFIKHSKIKHEVKHNLELLEGIIRKPIINDCMEFWYGEEEKEFAVSILPSDCVCIAVAVVGSNKNRCWNPTNYVKLFGELLNNNNKLRFVIIGGNDAVESASLIKKQLGNSVIDLTGTTTLLQAAALIDLCKFFVGSDTGLLHIASAFGLPEVMISMVSSNAPVYVGSSPVRTGPWRVDYKIVQPQRSLDDCAFVCKKEYPHCINQISVQNVFDAMTELRPDLFLEG